MASGLLFPDATLNSNYALRAEQLFFDYTTEEILREIEEDFTSAEHPYYEDVVIFADVKAEPTLPRLEAWYEDEALRRQKIGVALIKAAERWAVQKGLFKELVLFPKTAWTRVDRKSHGKAWLRKAAKPGCDIANRIDTYVTFSSRSLLCNTQKILRNCYSTKSALLL